MTEPSTDKTADLPPASGETLDPDSVAAWLRDHPDFFDGREALLADMVLPHASTGAVSLVERQVAVLRERNIDARTRLNSLLKTAEVNHRIFERTLDLTLKMLDADDAGAVLARLGDGLRDGYDLDAVALHRIGDGGDGAAAGSAAQMIDREEAESRIGNLLRPGRIVCGMLRDAEMAFLFGEGRAIASAAVMPLQIGDDLLVIALGSKAPDHFTPDMGTLFIRFLGETVKHLLDRDQRRSADGAESSGAA